MKKQIKKYLKDVDRNYKISDDIDYFVVNELNKLYNYLLDFIDDDYRIEAPMFTLYRIYEQQHKVLFLIDWIKNTNILIEQYLVSLEEYEKIVIFKKNIDTYVL